MRLLTAALLALTVGACTDRPQPAADSPTPGATPEVMLPVLPETTGTAAYTPPDPTVDPIPTASPSVSPTPAARRPATGRPTPRPSFTSDPPRVLGPPDTYPASGRVAGETTVTGRVERIGSAPMTTLALVTPTGTVYRLTGPAAILTDLGRQQGQTRTATGTLDPAAPEPTLVIRSVRP